MTLWTSQILTDFERHLGPAPPAISETVPCSCVAPHAQCYARCSVGQEAHPEMQESSALKRKGEMLILVT